MEDSAKPYYCQLDNLFSIVWKSWWSSFLSTLTQRRLKNILRNLRNICCDEMGGLYKWHWKLWIARRWITKIINKKIHININMLSKNECPKGELSDLSRIFRGYSWRSWKSFSAPLPHIYPQNAIFIIWRYSEGNRRLFTH